MPNIVIVGLMQKEAQTIRKRVEIIVEKLNYGTDAITTILETGTKTKWCNSENRAPYLIVRDTAVTRAREIAMALNEELNLDVEYEKLDGFLAARPVT